MDAPAGTKSFRTKFWIITKIVFGFIVMSYFIWLLANKRHFMDKLFSKEFIDSLKVYKEYLIILMILLAIKLINKICSLFAKGNFKSMRYKLIYDDHENFSEKKTSRVNHLLVYLFRLSDITNNYARENQFGISYILYKFIRFCKH